MAPWRRCGGLAIEVRPDTASTVSVDAMDEEGRVLVSAVGSTAGESEGVPNLAVAPGTYFVRVRPGGTPASSPAADASRDAGVVPTPAYELTVRLGQVEPGGEIEPNGKGALASEVEPGGEVAGFLGWRHDEDWFRLPMENLPEGNALSADLDPVEGVVTSLAVYDSVEHKVTEQRGRRGERVAIRNVRLPSSERYMFVVVRAESGRNLHARYVLHLRTEPAQPDAELEPNDDPAHAGVLVDGTMSGFLGPGDRDVFRYTTAMPVELDVEVASPDHVNAKLEVLREDGAVTAKIDTARRRGETERLANLFVDGTALIRLSAGKGEGNLDEPYHITVSSRPPEAGAEREPNGTAALATPLAIGTTGTGLLFPRGDLDVWSLVVPPGSSDALAVGVRGISGMTLDVRVQATSGKELSRFRVGADASAPMRVVPPADGCCLVLIREASGRGASPRERYSLLVTR